MTVSALLSRALVAFTIELDNEAEHRLPHRTTESDLKGSGPWLASLVMWLNCLQFVAAGELSLAEVEARAGTKTNWDGMRRWGYVTLDGAGARGSRVSTRLTTRVRATSAGLGAAAIWRPLPNEIEQRWRDRFGGAIIDNLCAALGDVIGRSEFRLPVCLPILRYGLFCPEPIAAHEAPNARDADACLVVLLSQALVMFALDFEHNWPLSLAICANILPALGEEPTRLADLPGLTGVSKAAIDMAIGFLAKQGQVDLGHDGAARRSKTVRLTSRGESAKTRSTDRLAEVEQIWRARFGAERIEAIREPLIRLAGNDRRELLAGIRSYPEGWRARSPAPGRLPDFPMVLHRGGFPDGS